MSVTFRVLGPFEAYVGETPVDLGGPRPRLLLARLIIARGATVSVDALVDDLYNGEPPPRAVGALHSYVSNLRRLLEPGRAPRTPSSVLVNRPPGYALVTGGVDADEFTRLARSGAYGEALRLWRGTPYEEFADVPWLRAEIERLNEAHLTVREKHLAELFDGGDPNATAEIEALAHAHPLREGLWGLLARALYRLGRQADALEALRTARVRLAAELGLDPGPELRRLEAAILAQDPSLDPPAASPVGVIAGGAGGAEGRRDGAGAAGLVDDATGGEETPGGGDVTGRGVAGEGGGGQEEGEISARAASGRAPQLERLDKLADEARGGRPRFAVISGEPGIGKTWLATAFAERLAPRGWRVAWGHCHETSGAPALWPWQQIARELSVEVPPDGLATALDVLLEDEPAAGPPAEAGEARFRLHRGVAGYLGRVAADRPLLIVVDDLQWADVASLDLLADLAALLRGRVVVAVTVRSGEGGPAVYDALGMLGRADALRLPLAGLDAATVGALVAEMLASGTGDGTGGEAGGGGDVAGLAGPEQAAALTERTRGNPLFVREIVRLAEDQGMARALTTVPEGLADVLRRRLLRLSAEHRAVLEAATVLGAAADRQALAEMCGRDVDGALDTAVRMRLLADDLRFAHDLVRETIYGDISSARRSELHLKALSVLERRPGPDLAMLARHAIAAGPPAAERAVRWASATARQSSARHAYEDAALWWRRAVDTHAALADADPAEHVELLLGLVRAQLDAGDGVAARRTRAEAVRAADGSGDPVLTARALTSLEAPGLWRLFNTYGDLELHTVRRIEDALAALPPGDSELRCRLLGCLGMELLDVKVDPRCDTASAEALAMARRLVARGEADARLLAVTLNARYLSILTPERLAEVDAIGRELTELGLPGSELLGHMILARTRLEVFDIEGADRAAERAAVLVERLDLPWPRFQHLLWTGARRLIDGDFAAADAAFAAAAEAGERLNLWHTQAVLASAVVIRTVLLGLIAPRAGRSGPVAASAEGDFTALADSDFAAWQEEGVGHPGSDAPALGGPHAREFDVASPEIEDLILQFSPIPAHRQIMRVLFAHARDDAPALREAVKDGWREIPWDFSGLSSLCCLGWAQLAAGDTAAAAATYERLLPYAGRLSFGSSTFPVGPVGYYLGRMAPDPGAARAHLDAAAERCERAGLTWWAGVIAAERRSLAGGG
ncbi:BTAD domain-containing putative transcriptional regulator [Thermopolyspora sp. NPDC052614]|uniref:AAA family ATPase n=1 Tax=Thermopolyspora sp. NPDC052614 TaxID=3155682 RepID=UPI00343B91BA